MFLCKSGDFYQLPSDAFEEESSSSGTSGTLFRRILVRSVTCLIVKSGFGSPLNKSGFSIVGIQIVPPRPASIPPR